MIHERTTRCKIYIYQLKRISIFLCAWCCNVDSSIQKNLIRGTFAKESGSFRYQSVIQCAVGPIWATMSIDYLMTIPAPYQSTQRLLIFFFFFFISWQFSSGQSTTWLFLSNVITLILIYGFVPVKFPGTFKKRAPGPVIEPALLSLPSPILRPNHLQ